MERHRFKERLKDPNPAVRAAALRRLNEDKFFTEALHDEDADVRFIGVERLGHLGAKQAERANALIPLLKDDQRYVRREAAWSLGYIGRDAGPALQEALDDENPRVRAGAALALSGVGQKGNWVSKRDEAIVTRLRKLLNDEDLEVQTNAQSAIDSLTP
jgi:HEAT repeat protein